MARLEVRYETGERSLVVGHLLSAERSIFFQYDDAFRGYGLELSPFKLPTSIVGPIEERERTYHGLHGLFNDSLPDGWGMIVMERTLRARGIEPASITPLDRLAFLGSRTMGALTYHPSSADDDAENMELHLSAVAEQSGRIMEGSTEEILPEIVKAGSSPMGARPKIVAGVRNDFSHLVTGTSSLPEGYSHWLIKFTAKEDPSDMGAIEMAYAEMARAAGLAIPRTHLFITRDGKRYFGVKRFDRDPALPARRIHTHTFAGLLHYDHRIPGQDYHDLLKVTRVLTRKHGDVLEAFRRMLFNILAYNRDDHTKNFAFQMTPDAEWRLAPAYDITYSDGPGGEHTLLIAGEGRSPNRSHIDEIAVAASLESREVRHAIESVQQAVSTWYEIARRYDVSESSIRSIQDRLNTVHNATHLETGVSSSSSAGPSRARARRRKRE